MNLKQFVKIYLMIDIIILFSYFLLLFIKYKQQSWDLSLVVDELKAFIIGNIFIIATIYTQYLVSSKIIFIIKYVERNDILCLEKEKSLITYY